jgi:hypothetical protein
VWPASPRSLSTVTRTPLCWRRRPGAGGNSCFFL